MAYRGGRANRNPRGVTVCDLPAARLGESSRSPTLRVGSEPLGTRLGESGYESGHGFFSRHAFHFANASFRLFSSIFAHAGENVPAVGFFGYASNP